MRLLFLSFIIATASFAQTPEVKDAPKPTSKAAETKPAPKTAEPIPAARHEEISRLMLSLQQAQIESQSIQIASVRSQKQVKDEQAKYDALVESLKKEFHAEGCDLTLQKTWACAPAK
jgi:hypothetical protein